MPDDETLVLVWAGDDLALAWHDSSLLEEPALLPSGWRIDDAAGSSLPGVTHWCPAPQPPRATPDIPQPKPFTRTSSSKPVPAAS